VFDQNIGTATSYALTTPLSNGTTYYWRVKASNLYGEATSSTFSFTTINLPSITLTYPNGGEILVVGSSIGNIYTIKWNYSGISSGSLNIDLYKGETLNKTIVSSCSITTGGYDWTIPTDQTPGDDYKIKITYTTDTTIYDISDGNFSIVFIHLLQHFHLQPMEQQEFQSVKLMEKQDLHSVQPLYGLLQHLVLLQ